MALSSRRLPSLLRVPASPVPRSRRYYEGATTSHPRVHGRLLVRFHCPRVPPGSCSPQRSRKVGGPLPGRGSWSAGARSVRLALRGRDWDLSGLQAIPSCAFAPLRDPGRTNVPSPYRSRRCCPLVGRRRLRQSLISGLTRSFGTHCHTLHADVAAHVQGLLPAGRLGLCRVGVEPTGSLRVVSARIDDHPPLLLS